MTAIINKVVYGNTTLIDLTDATLGASDGDKILTGDTAYGKDGAKITGSCTYDSNTTDADASAGEILYGKTAYVNKNKLTGQMPNNGGNDVTITTLSDVTISAGYYDGSGKAKIDSTEAGKIVAGNIRNGVTILGVTGTYAGQSATATSLTATPYTTSKTYLPSASNVDYFSQATVSAIYYNESANSYGTTVTIGTVDPDA